MNYYFLPAFIALALKLTILLYVLSGKKVSTVFLSLLLVFACHNAIELIGFFKIFQEISVAAHFRVYYVATIAMLMCVNLQVLSIARIAYRTLIASIVMGSVGLAGAILFTDSVVAGAFQTNLAMSAVEGPWYFLFGFYIVTTFASVVWVLVNTYRYPSDPVDAQKALYTLFALLPLVVVFLAALALKLLGHGGAAAGALPLGTTLFLIIMLKTESKHHLTDLRRFLPFSAERNASTEFLRLMDVYSQNLGDADSFSELRNGVERQAVLYTLEKSGNNITKAAEMMGLQNRSTLYSMMKRLEISPRDSQA